MPAQFFDLVDDYDVDPPKRDAIEQGADFDWAPQFQSDDVTGTTEVDWLCRAQIRTTLADSDSGDPLVDLDSDTVGGIVLEVAGDVLTMTWHIDDAVTEGLPIGRHRYDFELVRLSDGYVRRLGEGAAQVRGEVTR